MIQVLKLKKKTNKKRKKKKEFHKDKIDQVKQKGTDNSLNLSE